MPRIRLLLACFLFLAGILPARAFVRTMSSSGRPLFWSSPSQTLRGNPLNASGLSQAQVSSLLGDSFAAWNVPGSLVGLSYAQSTGNPAAGRVDGINAVYFASNGGRNLGWGVVALTEVFYFVSNGQIAEADMVFNDNQFTFTANAGDTGQSVSGRTAIYLRDVATHEAGHVLGLDHSLVNLSSLIYTAFNGQYSLSNDDKSAAKTVYSASSSGGAITGTVQGTQGGIFGAHVVAVNLLSGEVEAGALAASDGSFRLGDLPAGKYAVMMEPFGTDSSSVSSYYQNVDHRFCGWSLFRRRFYSSCSSQGSVTAINVDAGSSTGLGTLAPSCSSMGNPGGPPNSIASAKLLPPGGGAAWGTLHAGDVHYYKVQNVSGLLNARAMAYSLYSPVDVRVQVLDANGNALAGATSVDNVANPGAGGVVNYDSSASATVPSGDYVIQVTAAPSRISASKYSAGYELQDADGHYLVSLAVNGDITPSPLTDMSGCVSVRNRAQSATFQDAPSSPPREKATGCGTLSSGGQGPFSGGIMQVLLTAFILQALSLARRFRTALVRRRR